VSAVVQEPASYLVVFKQSRRKSGAQFTKLATEVRQTRSTALATVNVLSDGDVAYCQITPNTC